MSCNDDQVIEQQLALLAPLAGLLGSCDSEAAGDRPSSSSSSSSSSCARLIVLLWRVPRSTGADRLRVALAALAQLLRFGRGLRRAQSVRLLWQRVLQSTHLFAGGGGDAAATAADAETQVRRLLRDGRRVPHVLLDVSRTQVDASLVAALGGFFESLESDADGPASARYLTVDLRLSRCRLTSQQLRLLQQLLARRVGLGAPGDERRVRVGSLDLSDNGMGAAEMLVLVELLRSNHIHRLDELVLVNCAGRAFATGDGVASFRALVEAAFAASASSAEVAGSDGVLTAPPQPPQPYGLASFSLCNNALSGTAYAAVCSAFRHSRGVKNLSLEGTLSMVDPSTREWSWRWLAFGVFSPGPRGVRPACSVRRVDLSGNPLFLNDVAAFRRTLLDPVNELVLGSAWATGESGAEVGAVRETGVCSVLQGTKVYLHPSVASEQTFEVDRPRQLEVLCVWAEWVCVVIPAFGFGWAQAEHVTRIRQGDIVLPVLSSEADTVRFELVLNKLRVDESTSLALSSLLEALGDRLCALELRHYRLDHRVVESIATHCTRLERLDLEGSSLYGSGAVLLNAMRGSLGDCLLSLNLNNSQVGFEFAEQLGGILSDAVRAPPLQELCLFKSLIGDRGLASLHDALAVNKTLVRVELGPASGSASPTEHAFTASFHDELLRVEPLPLRLRLAFLSVFSSASPGTSQARCDIDSWMLREVLTFAGDEVRREILWRG